MPLILTGSTCRHRFPKSERRRRLLRTLITLKTNGTYALAPNIKKSLPPHPRLQKGISRKKRFLSIIPPYIQDLGEKLFIAAIDN